MLFRTVSFVGNLSLTDASVFAELEFGFSLVFCSDSDPCLVLVGSSSANTSSKIVSLLPKLANIWWNWMQKQRNNSTIFIFMSIWKCWNVLISDHFTALVIRMSVTELVKDFLTLNLDRESEVFSLQISFMNQLLVIHVMTLFAFLGGSASFNPTVVYPGVAIFLQNALIFFSSLVYKFGRSEDNWNWRRKCFKFYLYLSTKNYSDTSYKSTATESLFNSFGLIPKQEFMSRSHCWLITNVMSQLIIKK